LLIRFLFRLLAALPLSLAVWLGTCAGRLAARFNARLTTRARQQLRIAYPTEPRERIALVANAALANQGRLIAETAHIWLRPADMGALVRSVQGWELVEASRANGQPIIFLVPHLGAFELGGQYLNERIPMAALYRAPKIRALEPLMQAGRNRVGGETYTADLAGVRGLLKSLKTGRSLMILPDQAPQEGDGIWAPFFGHFAYTMTLPARLAEKTGARLLIMMVPRREDGRGYDVIIEPGPPLFASRDRLAAATAMNAAVERCALTYPTQYQWHYNRYKQPAGAPLPPLSPGS
jgi:Kdo2-lipid IVA lauroyltransferase/acyltransferase